MSINTSFDCGASRTAHKETEDSVATEIIGYTYVVIIVTLVSLQLIRTLSRHRYVRVHQLNFIQRAGILQNCIMETIGLVHYVVCNLGVVNGS